MNEQLHSTAGANLGHVADAEAKPRSVLQIEEMVADARREGTDAERKRCNRRMAVIERSIEHALRLITDELSAVRRAIADARADFLQDVVAAAKDSEPPTS